MSDERPLRQEDYRAMAEEVQRLRRECADLRAQQTRSTRRPAEPRWAVALWASIARHSAEIACVAVMFYSVFGTAFGIGRAVALTDSPRVCSFVESTSEDNTPWDRWRLRSLRGDGRLMTVKNDDQTFPTREEGEAFVRKWGLLRCPESVVEKVR